MLRASNVLSHPPPRKQSGAKYVFRALVLPFMSCVFLVVFSLWWHCVETAVHDSWWAGGDLQFGLIVCGAGGPSVIVGVALIASMVFL